MQFVGELSIASHTPPPAWTEPSRDRKAASLARRPNLPGRVSSGQESGLIFLLGLGPLDHRELPIACQAPIPRCLSTACHLSLLDTVLNALALALVRR